jgi:hypothetical protein
MTDKEWIALFAGQLGVEPPTDAETEELLALAAVAAHASERTAAPVSCWLIARAGVSPSAALALASAVAPSEG